MAYHFRREILNVNQAGFFNFKVAHGYYYRHSLIHFVCFTTVLFSSFCCSD